MPQLSFHTPLGALTLSEEDGAIVALDWGFGRDQEPTRLLLEGRDQLQAYFDGALRNFTLPLAPAGTPYQRKVWQALSDIPYGRTQSYGEVAARAGGSPRSVGGANGANPIPIIVPCHRVVGGTGLGGYSGGEGLATKGWLLALEREVTGSNQLRRAPADPGPCGVGAGRSRPDEAVERCRRGELAVSEER